MILTFSRRILSLQLSTFVLMKWSPFYTVMFSLWVLPLWSQNLLVNDSNGDLVSIDIEGCNTTVVADIGFYTDIAAHPNGFFYGVNTVGKLTRINVQTGETNQVEDFTSTAYYALTANAEGLLFAASGLGDLVSYNPSNNQTTYYDNMGFKAAGDLTYYQGDMYMATDENKLVYIDPLDPSNNEVFIDFASSNSSIYGIVSTVDGCNVSTYAFSNDNNAKVYQIDWINKSFDFVCNIDKEVYGGSSEFEFAASDDLIQIDSIVINAAPCDEGTSQVIVYASSEIGALSYSIDGINYQDDNEFFDLTYGDYTLYIQDESGCIGNEDISIDVGYLVFENTQVQNAICGQNNGVATIRVDASTQDLMYSIDGINYQSSPVFSDLAPGMYDVYVISNQSCEISSTFEVAISSSIQLINTNAYGPSCDEGFAFIDIEATSPNGGLMYSLDGINFQSEAYFGNLEMGVYTVYIVDALGCEDTFEVIMEAGILSLANVVTSPETCESSNGSATLIVQSSLANYDLFIDGENVGNTSTIQGLDGGIYQITLIGADACSIEYDLVIDEILTYELDTILLSPDFCNQGEGSIEVLLNDNGNNISYWLDNSLQDESGFIQNVVQGDYLLEIVDQNNCSSSFNVSIEQDDCPIFIPNVFAPSIGGNDRFSVQSAYDLSVENWFVYDRWGNQLYMAEDFSINDSTVFWDGTFNGKEVPAGVYVFSLNIQGFEEAIVGDITLVR